MKKPHYRKYTAILLTVILASGLVYSIKNQRNVPMLQSHQTRVDVITAVECLQRAAKLHTAAFYDSSNYYYDLALYQLIREEQWEKAIDCLCGKSTNFVKSGRYEDAKSQVDSASHILALFTSTNEIPAVKILNARGIIFQKRGDLAAAESAFHEAICLLKKTDSAHDEELANSYHGLGIVNYFYGQYDKAAEFYEDALAIRKKVYEQTHPLVADSYVNLGILALAREDFENAMAYYQKGLAIRLEAVGENHPDVSNSYLNLGVLHFTKGDYDRAIECYEKSIRIVQNRLGSNHPSLAGNYLNLGTIWLRKGNLEDAQAYFQKSLSLVMVTISDTHPIIASLYNNLGIISKNKEMYDEALHYYQQSLNVQLRMEQRVHPDIVRCQLNIANIYSLKKDFNRAIEYYRQALSMARQLSTQQHSLMAIIYNNMGILYTDLGDFNIALHYLNKSVSLSQRIWGNNHPLIAEAYQQIAEVYHRQHRIRKALSCLQRALHALFPGFDSDNVYVNPPLTQLNEETRLLDILTRKAELFNELYLDDRSHIENLEASVVTYTLISDLIEHIRTGYKSENLKLFLGEKMHSIYGQAITSVFELYTITHAHDLKEVAFSFAEKSKSGALHQALIESNARKFAGIPDSLLDTERQLKIDLSFTDKLLFDETQKGTDADSERVRSLQNRLFQLKRNYESLVNTFELNYPAYYNLTYQTANATAKQIQDKILDSDTGIIEYYLSDSTLFIFTITKTTFEIRSISIDDSFTASMDRMRSGLLQQSFTDYSIAAHTLYCCLISPVKSYLYGHRLIIIPDGLLGYLPFETLLAQPPAPQTEDYRTLSFLMSDYLISYSYSASLLFENLSRPKASFDRNFTGFAPIFFQ
ncbi:MAG: CHAT domain-containing protein [Candidatus Zhuqueibacterota bacterium]